MFDYDNSKLDYPASEDIAGLIGQYIHGSEPSHHVAYLYNYAGRPWRTQERLAQIVAIGRPFVDRAVLTLPNGRTFTVVAQGLSPANRYIGQVVLNGRPLERSVVGDAALRAGGELRFTVQATPNRRWATRKRSRPCSMSGC